MGATKYERHFEGPSNAGLRKQIREAVRGVMPACGDLRERAVMAAGRRTALTGLGEAKLLAVAADYRAAGGRYDPRCSCYSCVAVGRDNLSQRRF